MSLVVCQKKLKSDTQVSEIFPAVVYETRLCFVNTNKKKMNKHDLKHFENEYHNIVYLPRICLVYFPHLSRSCKFY